MSVVELEVSNVNHPRRDSATGLVPVEFTSLASEPRPDSSRDAIVSVEVTRSGDGFIAELHTALAVPLAVRVAWAVREAEDALPAVAADYATLTSAYDRARDAVHARQYNGSRRHRSRDLRNLAAARDEAYAAWRPAAQAKGRLDGLINKGKLEFESLKRRAEEDITFNEFEHVEQLPLLPAVVLREALVERGLTPAAAGQVIEEAATSASRRGVIGNESRLVELACADFVRRYGARMADMVASILRPLGLDRKQAQEVDLPDCALELLKSAPGVPGAEFARRLSAARDAEQLLA